MELSFYGANCLRLTTKQASIVTDDNLTELGLKLITKPTDISLNTWPGITGHSARFMVNTPGDYEISGVIIRGIAARGARDPEDQANAVIYTVATDDLRAVVLGHIHPSLSDEQVEQIGHVDVAVVPVGGNGYTLDGVGALQVIKKIEPKIVIPTHYADRVIKYEVPQAELAEALKALGMEPTETVDKYRPKAGELTDTTHLIVLKRQ